MDKLFKNKYKTNSSRLEGWDYTDGWYFVTICTENRKIFFGEIRDGKMILSQIGEIVQEELLKTPLIRRNVILDKWVIMPNHIHIIIAIDNVETHCNASLRSNKFGPQKNNLPSITRGLKGITTKRIHLNGYPNLAWQSGYHDHIIRGEKDYQNIWDYIDYNPDKWQWDRENPENLKKK